MQSTLRRFAPGLMVVLALGFCAAAPAAPPPKTDAKGVLTTAHGLTLYTYAPDGTQGQSMCTGSCAAIWPPYLAAPGAQAAVGFGLVTRQDHGLQWSYQGRPLYRYAGDTAPGMTKGDGINGQWHVAYAH